MNLGATQRLELARAVALLDLQRSGVRSELGSAPYDWFQTKAAAEVKPVVAAAAPTPVSRSAAVEVALPPARTFTQAVAIEPKILKNTAVANAVVPVQVWTQGEQGGVVLVRRADGTGAGADGPELTVAEARLLKNILMAVGLAEQPLGHVVLGGKQDVVQPPAQAELRAAVGRMQPQALLVLGQAAVGTLAGQALGVEGWQAFAGSADAASRAVKLLGEGAEAVAMTVTYPLELLLARALFKRLAWQHLQNWEVAGIKTQGIAGNA